MKVMKTSMVAAALAILSLCAVATAQADLITNGDFETTTGWGAPGTTSYPPSWGDVLSTGYSNAAAQQGTPNAIGGNTSAYMPTAVTTLHIRFPTLAT